ncbi:hypothetical protein T11_12238 [Trichinella zimbabwensis]|uniref:Uncharacterized protein n=1 Tax=Trichinella zimbabwensis TaxID=268475 RepID=A0A0V1GNW0_9BILA|nr:hypothetical protein T11_12238 [Trichinella zimbabwensis]
MLTSAYAYNGDCRKEVQHHGVSLQQYLETAESIRLQKY